MKVIDTSKNKLYKSGYYLMLYGVIDMWRDKTSYTSLKEAQAAAEVLMTISPEERACSYNEVGIMEAKMVRRIVND